MDGKLSSKGTFSKEKLAQKSQIKTYSLYDIEKSHKKVRNSNEKTKTITPLLKRKEATTELKSHYRRPIQYNTKSPYIRKKRSFENSFLGSNYMPPHKTVVCRSFMTQDIRAELQRSEKKIKAKYQELRLLCKIDKDERRKKKQNRSQTNFRAVQNFPSGSPVKNWNEQPQLTN